MAAIGDTYKMNRSTLQETRYLKKYKRKKRVISVVSKVQKNWSPFLKTNEDKFLSREIIQPKVIQTDLTTHRQRIAFCLDLFPFLSVPTLFMNLVWSFYISLYVPQLPSHVVHSLSSSFKKIPPFIHKTKNHSSVLLSHSTN